MIKPPTPADERQRQAELDSYDLLASGPQEAFDRVTRQLSSIFEAPVAAMSLIDREVQVHKSAVSSDEVILPRVMPREMSVCGHVVAANELLVVDDLSTDPRFADNPLIVQSGARFYAGAPLRGENGRAIGSLCILDSKPRHLNEREKELLKMVAEGLMAEVKLRVVSRRLLERNRVVEGDLNQARRVQRFLLPPSSITGEGFRVSHLYRPADRIGGDLIDVRVRGDGSVMLLVADVSGHGASAALTSAMAKTVFLRAAGEAAGPEEILSAINRELAATVETGRFITAQAMLFCPDDRAVHISSAGHPYPLLIRGQQVQTLHMDNDPPLLLEDGTFYRVQSRIELASGDRLLLYTDGATEALDAQGRQLGAAHLTELIHRASDLPDEPFLQGVFRGVDKFAQGTLSDDVALLCLRVT